MMDMSNYTNAIKKLYGTDPGVLEKQTKRYQQLDEEFLYHFDEHERFFFSAPGRTELSGNHTDHNNGRVLAASVNLDSIAVASKNNTRNIILHSNGFDLPFKVDLNLLEVDEKEEGSTTALIRGIASRFVQLGFQIGGFSACMSSDVLPGSGLSSSASVEVLIGSIFNHLFNDGKIPAQTIANIGQYAENVYFGKPCGLMDQMACAIGGVIAIDFEDLQNPIVEKIEFDFEEHDHSMVIVDTGGSHVDLTTDYASIPEEMNQVAGYFGKKVLREVSEEQFTNSLSSLRESVSDRAVLRAMHFFAENKRVELQLEKLRDNDFSGFLSIINKSGNSSFRWLQNIYSTKDTSGQGVTLALALTEKYITEIGAGACRVHGGGFAGTIQVFIPTKHLNNYIKIVEEIFGKGCALVLSIREQGALKLNNKV